MISPVRPGGRSRPYRVDDADLDALEGTQRCPAVRPGRRVARDQRAGLGQPVPLDHADRQGVLDGVDQIGRARRPADVKGAQRAQGARVDVAAVEQGLEHGRDDGFGDRQPFASAVAAKSSGSKRGRISRRSGRR